MIQLYECPNCGKDSAAFVTTKDMLGGPVRCPACAPIPDKEPHDYRPVMVGGVVLTPGLVGHHVYVLPSLNSGVVDS